MKRGKGYRWSGELPQGFITLLIRNGSTNWEDYFLLSLRRCRFEVAGVLGCGRNVKMRPGIQVWIMISS